jgi:hypothetical protein
MKTVTFRTISANTRIGIYVDCQWAGYLERNYFPRNALGRPAHYRWQAVTKFDNFEKLTLRAAKARAIEVLS